MEKEVKKGFKDLAIHHCDGKPSLAIIDPDFLNSVATILDFGDKKYEPGNWLKGGSFTSFINSALRHIEKFNKGEYLDEESGLSHLAHAACNLMFLDNWVRNEVGLDDRRFVKRD